MFDRLKEEYSMYIENTQLEDLKVDQEVLSTVMRKFGLECHGAWDYDRMVFDRCYDVREGRYYLRVFCNAVSGDVGAHNATLNILKPAVGKYYYPHGVEYTDEVFPEHLVKECQTVLTSVRSELQAYGI